MDDFVHGGAERSGETAAAAAGARSAGADTGQAETPGVIEKAYLVIDALTAEGAPVGVSRLARRAGLPKTTVHRILRVLTEMGVADHQGSKYRVGWRLISLADATVMNTRHSGLRDRLLPDLLDLFQRTGHTVHLGVLRDSAVLCLEQLHGHRPPAIPVRVGESLPADRTALGRALLAYQHDLDPADSALPVRVAVAGGGAAGERRRQDAPTAPRLLSSELEKVRQTGVAVDFGVFRSGVACVAAPVWDHRRQATAAISVAGPISTFDVAQVVRALRHVSHCASRALAAV